MGKRNYFKMSLEDERQIMLDIALVISNYGTDGASMGEIQEEIEKKHQGINVANLVKVKLSKCLGKISKGERRWVKYIIDDLDVACQLINQYYDSGMTEYELWNLRKSICEYIIENPGVTTEKICDEFSIEDQFLDEMNSELVKYNVGLNFYKSTNKGTKVRIDNEMTIPCLNGIIEDVRKKESPKHPSKVESTEESSRKLSRMDPLMKKKIQSRLVEIIYSKDRMSTYDISKRYIKIYKEDMKYQTIDSMMSGVPGVGHSKDGYYWIKDINESMNYVDPIKGLVDLEIVSKDSIDLEKYPNIKFSREFEGLKIYKLKCRNEYSVILDIFDLILSGVSIDTEVREKVIDIVKNNLKAGDKYLL